MFGSLNHKDSMYQVTSSWHVPLDTFSVTEQGSVAPKFDRFPSA